ncbi:MAG TPA: HPr-rel-A system PqqD family peptide chaperone [Arenibaculum sp.]|nr:HPr-rel-A system PqqD family peptide chaperone [Arenibaculum sp.]
MTPAGCAPLLRAATAGTIRRHRFHDGDAVVVFDGRSGLTHCLNGAAVAALDILAAAPMTAAGLADALAARLGVTADDGFVRSVEALAVSLDGLGLVEPVGS